ncbi:isoaspartyl peptidase/L-asparaginase family protein [Marinicaulis aureus]|uniref:Isoaspartyl peptidase/L-asparaginase family protein n=1 Tax=Hyphococcus aureus TaxID=2666033 RepID=A0ABW1L0A1_9PROT
MRIFLTLAAIFCAAPAMAEHYETAPVTIVIHGGAGALAPGRYTPEEEAAFEAKLNEALDAGYAVLENGGAALDAVEAAIVLMEDAPMFNAGKGAVFTRDGKNELDSSIMDGATLNAGAVAGVTRVKNPIKLARAVMEKSDHVMFARDGAEKFAKENDLEMVKPSYFKTEHRWDAYKRALEAEKNKQKDAALFHDFKYGTVGAVALDAKGNLAAGTSTGGMMMKRYGRVGDTPIIGAGTFADNKSCAVSSTGWGEYFIRLTIARDICAQVEYQGKSVEEAADDVINHRLQDMGADGGVIVLAPDGSYAMTFNSKGMFRGVRNAEEKMIAIYGNKAE